LLEPDSESDTLPLDADPALDADEAKLSAWACKARPSALAATINRKELFINIFLNSANQEVYDLFTPQKGSDKKEFSPSSTKSGI
jgi:hypothetical protein